MNQPDIPAVAIPLADATPAARFHALYITSNEICKRVGVSRASLLQARRNGYLPDGIPVNGNDIYIWERALAEPHLRAWEELHRVKAARANLAHPATTPHQPTA